MPCTSVPSGHCSHAACPVAPRVVHPGAHGEHATAPASPENVPDGQASHVCSPPAPWEYPGAQGVQAVALSASLTLPGGHGEHSEANEFEKLPAEHARHSARPGVGLYEPPSHGKHGASP